MNVKRAVLTCAGCGCEVPYNGPSPFRCPEATEGDDIAHILRRCINPLPEPFPSDGDPNPFLRYHRFLYSYWIAMEGGLTTDQYLELVGQLDSAVAEVDGRGFEVTPFERESELAKRCGLVPSNDLWVKDETGNVSGSHKARHHMGLLITLTVLERLGYRSSGRDGVATALAIASCGNAALAAAVLARAARRTLDVYIPTDAHPRVVERLNRLRARIIVCPRAPEQTGDPCYHAFRQAVRDGAIPFSCQGPDNGLTIEGGQTLAYEMISDLLQTGQQLDRLFIQVGGGALASACIAAFKEAVTLGLFEVMPRIHAVQTEGAHPLERGHRLVVERMGGDCGPLSNSQNDCAQEALQYAATHRSKFMWAWEQAPTSVAHGILDDETYDWLAVVRGMIESSGYPIVVSEEELREANTMASSSTSIDVDHTGTAGLAGLFQLQRQQLIGPEESVGVLFTGARRG